MRYIDADALMEKVGFLEGRCVGVYKSDIEKMPTADVAPVVHGAWVVKHERVMASMFYEQISCPICKRRNDKQSNFCPSCGAKMDGDT